MAKRIKWPSPPERDDLHKYLGQEAARLREVYEETGKGGSGIGQQRMGIRGGALDLLRVAEVPSSLVALFDMLLGGVTTELLSKKLRPTLIDTIVNYEARTAQLEDREVTIAELVDKAVMPNHTELNDRDYAMREVHKARKESWYWARVRWRQVYLIDNPDTV